MKLFLNSHFYFLASFILHGGIFLFFIFGTLGFQRNIDSFEASVMFETPDVPPPVKKIEPKESVEISKPVAAPILKSPGTTTISDSPLPAPSITSKRLDEILKNKTVKVKPEEKIDEPVVEQKSDLLGYLRATKRTKDLSKKPTPAKEEKEKTNPSAESRTESKQPEQQQSVESRLAEKLAQQNNADKEQSSQQATDQQETTESDSPVDPNVKRKSAALQVWQKKNNVQAYRSVLRKLVTANWTVPPVSVKTFQIVIEASIDKDGNLLNINLLESSGLAILDAAAERAIRVSTPFPGIPVSIAQESDVFKAVFRFTPDQVFF